VLGKIDHWRAAAKATGTVTTSAGALSGKQATAARMTISAPSTKPQRSTYPVADVRTTQCFGGDHSDHEGSDRDQT